MTILFLTGNREHTPTESVQRAKTSRLRPEDLKNLLGLEHKSRECENEAKMKHFAQQHETTLVVVSISELVLIPLSLRALM